MVHEFTTSNHSLSPGILWVLAVREPYLGSNREVVASLDESHANSNRQKESTMRILWDLVTIVGSVVTFIWFLGVPDNQIPLVVSLLVGWTCGIAFILGVKELVEDLQ